MRKKDTEFPFGSSRRITSQEVETARIAIKEQFGLDMPKRGRPTKKSDEQYKHVSIRLHPKVVTWAKEEAEKQGVGYQTIINEALLRITP